MFLYLPAPLMAASARPTVTAAGYVSAAQLKLIDVRVYMISQMHLLCPAGLAIAAASWLTFVAWLIAVPVIAKKTAATTWWPEVRQPQGSAAKHHSLAACEGFWEEVAEGGRRL